MTALLSIDPGDPHVGVALWVENDDGRWRCRRAREMTPVEFADALEQLLSGGKIQRVAYEVFALGGGQEALYQKGSTFGTVEVIGTARTLCRWHGIEMEPVSRARRKSTLTRMKAVRWKFPPGAPTHVKDAIAVGATALDWRAASHVAGDGVERT